MCVSGDHAPLGIPCTDRFAEQNHLQTFRELTLLSLNIPYKTFL